jgi:hypothetical protein
MKPLPVALDEYLALRRSLGYKLWEECRLLRQFVAFAGERGAEFITTDLALTWATRQPAEYSPYWCRRLRVVRHFAQYCSAHDPRTVVPPPGLLVQRYQRPHPISIATKRSAVCSPRLPNCRPRQGCGLAPS